MGNQFVRIDEKNWKRAMHCRIFRDSVEPAFCVSFELDITHFLQQIRKQHYSFTFALIHSVTVCANQIEEFRYRFVDGEVVLYDQIDTAFTYLDKETELFKVVNVPMEAKLEDYLASAAKTAEEQKEYFTGPLGRDVFQFSPLPWVSFTHISHTNSGKRDNATPLIDWGKYFQRDEKIILPFSVQAHHSFVDGLHIGKLANALQAYLDAF
ncbi:CatA-like O-acetyltransferase [Enterococcus hulanensis]|uniref:CatA-like O-acetyltransferase n=1 Tax=Enterococcus hulanensis TaxID=2559929 RepID=A0ABU3F178_9ENTE|nr:CatA-like O-acetyltransferase [Enterococcus hulanensis]MDT2600870.1 CatA-like O-acetyltransferase [Enterococcus hulanensis]MDT2611458.1 CatA-like O-acetyltransferase [Enterococcus hulanensis]MDT2618057.1 CatA-like O-acetyltransferase [Enterococcus hulanensis]MDT2629060.1 CatA-like O-acetyltransferase [Enterococcus hulanensis]MDT2656622.1 CatA-like O-acetyltransferase [Enterococcus hulanensis]